MAIKVFSVGKIYRAFHFILKTSHRAERRLKKYTHILEI